MLLMLLIYMLWLPALVGLGYATLRLLIPQKPPADPMQLLFYVFAGLLTLEVVALILNFFVAISALLTLPGLALGWAFLLYYRQDIRRSLSIASPVTWAGWSLLWGVMAVLVQYTVPYSSDAGAYYFQSIRWMTSEAITPGIANLIGRMGFNTGWFATAAMLELPGLAGQSTFFINGLLWVIVGLVSSADLHSPPLITPSRRFTALLAPIMLSMLLMPVGFTMIGSGSPDFPIMILCLGLIYAVLRMRKVPPDQQSYYLMLTLIFSLYGITLKLSAIPLLIIPLLLLMQYHFIGDALRTGFKVALWLLLPWLLRGLLLSGCAAFPVYQTCLPGLDWTVSQSQAATEQAWIESWARDNTRPAAEVLASNDWIAQWLPTTIMHPMVLLNLALLMLAAGCWIVNRQHRAAVPRIPVIFSGAALIFWFFTAPDIRFAGGYLFALSLVLLATNCPLPISIMRPIVIGLSGLILIGYGSLQIFGQASIIGWGGRTIPESTLIRQNSFIVPLDDGLCAPDEVRPCLPQPGDYGARQNERLCWNAALPCTPNPEQVIIVQDATGQIIRFEAAP